MHCAAEYALQQGWTCRQEIIRVVPGLLKGEN